MIENSNKLHSGGYEKKDVNIPLIVIIAVISIFILVILIVLLNDFFIIQKEDIVYKTVLSQTSQELIELRKVEFERLNQYKIIDAQKGIYQIPIDRAMQLISEGK